MVFNRAAEIVQGHVLKQARRSKIWVYVSDRLGSEPGRWKEEVKRGREEKLGDGKKGQKFGSHEK